MHFERPIKNPFFDRCINILNKGNFFSYFHSTGKVRLVIVDVLRVSYNMYGAYSQCSQH